MPLCGTLKILFFVSSLSQYSHVCCRFALIFFRFHIRILSCENNAFVLCDTRSRGLPRPHQAQRAINAFLLNFVFFPRLVFVQCIRWKMWNKQKPVQFLLLPWLLPFRTNWNKKGTECSFLFFWFRLSAPSSIVHVPTKMHAKDSDNAVTDAQQ